MSATEVLRRLLDERGVEYEGGERSVRWRDRNGVMMQAFPLADGELGMDVWSCTPEQAIAATLGSCNCTNDCTNGERTGTCLPHFWTHDGALHIELPKLPESISVRLPDQRDRDVSSASVWQFTRDSGTCHDKNGFDQDTGFECTVCGAMVDRYMITPDDTGHEVQFHYCPFCGREVDA